MIDTRQRATTARATRVLGTLLVPCALAATVGLGTAQAASATDPQPVVTSTRVGAGPVTVPFSAPALASAVVADPTLTDARATTGMNSRGVARGDREIGIMAEGGFDRDHWWFKISRSELVTIGARATCGLVFRGPLGSVVCPPLTQALDWLIGRFPVANGFWVEVFTDGRVNAGTW